MLGFKSSQTKGIYQMTHIKDTMTQSERIEIETELFWKLKQCYHAALFLELDDLADAIDRAEGELAEVITKNPELEGAE